MHRNDFTTRALEMIMGSQNENTPFVRENDVVFMKFDGLEITNSSREPSTLDVGFLWQGTPMCYLHIEGVRLAGDAGLCLRCIEGRQRVSLSSP